MYETLFLLLPVAATSGWILGRRDYRKCRKNVPISDSLLSSQYFTGLNYLLNEQTDKALDVFLSLLDGHNETVEIHLALGSLYRRTGETARAIRIHQNLIARPTLTRDQRTQSLLELSKDYIHAGVLDRAEHILLELVQAGDCLESTCRHLIEIYQQEKEWHRAIDAARRLEATSGLDLSLQIAHYHCEIAITQLEDGNVESAQQQLIVALRVNEGCARASILLGDLLAKIGKNEEAIEYYKKVSGQDNNYLSEVIKKISRCYEKLDKRDLMKVFSAEMLEQYPSTNVVLSITDWLIHSESHESALNFITPYLQDLPSLKSLSRWVELSASQLQGELQKDLELLHKSMKLIADQQPSYCCKRCGFSGHSLLWQCPGCKSWESMKPVHGGAA